LGLTEPTDELLEVVLEIWKKIESRHLQTSIVTRSMYGAQHTFACYRHYSFKDVYMDYVE